MEGRRKDGGLESRISRPGQPRDAFKIRGQAAVTQTKPELSIKGLASGGARSKELFPTKAVNTGKELFSDRIGSGRRQKAGDLFD